MNGSQLKQRLCGGAGLISLPIAEVKSRLGEPQEIRLARQWCKQTGRDLVVLTYVLDEGQAQVLGFMGFLDGEQALLNGWVVVEEKPRKVDGRSIHAPVGLPTPGLFDGPSGTAKEDSDVTKKAPGGAMGRQFELGDW